MRYLMKENIVLSMVISILAMLMIIVILGIMLWLEKKKKDVKKPSLHLTAERLYSLSFFGAVLLIVSEIFLRISTKLITDKDIAIITKETYEFTEYVLLLFTVGFLSKVIGVDSLVKVFEAIAKIRTGVGAVVSKQSSATNKRAG
jgi:nitric oxide reductase large subunit